MYIEVLQSKLAYACVTEAQLHYEGSISIDEDLLEAVGFKPNQKVQVLNLNNGNRFETYTIPAPRGSREICLNGPAARLGLVGDELIIISYCWIEPGDASFVKPRVVHLAKGNRIKP